MTNPAFKNSLIAKIHIAKKDLAMNDDDYRAVLERVTKKRSSRDLTPAQLNDVLQEMKKLGFKPKSTPKKAGNIALDKEPQSKKIRALWLSLHQSGQLADSSELALLKFVKKMTGIENLAWLDSKNANLVINALRGWITRTGGDPNGY